MWIAISAASAKGLSALARAARARDAEADFALLGADGGPAYEVGRAIDGWSRRPHEPR